MGKPKAPSSTTSEASPWGPAQDDLKEILEKAKEQFNKTGGLDAEWINREFPALSDEMKNALGNLSDSGKLGDLANQLGDMSAGGANNINNAAGALGGMTSGGITGDQLNDLANDLYDKDTVDNMKGELEGEVNHELDKNVQGLNQQAGSSGNMGSSRAGVAQGVMTGKAQEAISKGNSSIENNARNQAKGQALATLQGNQNTNLGAAGALGNLGMGQGGLANQSGNWLQQMLQNGLMGAQGGQDWLNNNAMNDWFNKQGASNAGWDNLGKWLGMAGAVGGMGGKQTNSGGGGGGGGGLNSILGIGSTAGGIMGGLGSMGFSDASMKKNVKKVGKSKKGETIYKWDWNDSAKKQGMSGKGRGALAQQLARDEPNAVKKDKISGRLMVDYDKTDIKPTNTKSKSKGK